MKFIVEVGSALPTSTRGGGKDRVPEHGEVLRQRSAVKFPQKKPGQAIVLRRRVVATLSEFPNSPLVCNTPSPPHRKPLTFSERIRRYSSFRDSWCDD